MDSQSLLKRETGVLGSAILLGTEQPIITSYVIMSSLSGWKAGTKLLSINFKSTGQYFRFFSTGHARSSPSLNVNPQELIEKEEKRDDHFEEIGLLDHFEGIGLLRAACWNGT
ncbi:hypothetical protein C4D60_Mb09t15520 [Musa balbisiana]|uniref:Uncharacterized protein n=1 Tax=Musa balbisiana TaxID=52838 RepID=A0A4S8IHF3_MUSBA|nr:hypothetical protein C4D60_Mb09t15520 [Musa balbisiana]